MYKIICQSSIWLTWSFSFIAVCLPSASLILERILFVAESRDSASNLACSLRSSWLNSFPTSTTTPKNDEFDLSFKAIVPFAVKYFSEKFQELQKINQLTIVDWEPVLSWWGSIFCIWRVFIIRRYKSFKAFTDFFFFFWTFYFDGFRVFIFGAIREVSVIELIFLLNLGYKFLDLRIMTNIQ